MALMFFRVGQITLLCPGRIFVFQGGWKVVLFSFLQVGLCEFQFRTRFGEVEICMVSFSPKKTGAVWEETDASLQQVNWMP